CLTRLIVLNPINYMSKFMGGVESGWSKNNR
ncbi:hypothetical protein LCGC14_2200630, partial [marine sediment metagenome]